jgi:hypothetical protein
MKSIWLLWTVLSLSAFQRCRSFLLVQPNVADHRQSQTPALSPTNTGRTIRTRHHTTADDDGERERLLESLGLDPRNNDALLEYSIDSFLRGDYDQPFADDAAAPIPGLTPGATVEAALKSLRQLNDPEPSHGAAVLLRFCAPLSRGERWGGSESIDEWKELLRGALTPTMLARRMRASQQFSGLLDWNRLDVTEGAYTGRKDLVGLPSIAFVSAALYFDEGNEPTLIQFKLRRIGGVWLIDSVTRTQKQLFVDDDDPPLSVW